MKKNMVMTVCACMMVFGIASQVQAMTQEEWEEIVRQSRGGDSLMVSHG